MNFSITKYNSDFYMTKKTDSSFGLKSVYIIVFILLFFGDDERCDEICNNAYSRKNNSQNKYQA